LVYEKHHIYREKRLNREGKPQYLGDLQHKEGDPERGREREGGEPEYWWMELQFRCPTDWKQQQCHQKNALV
jgi:hypothetical protein